MFAINRNPAQTLQNTDPRVNPRFGLQPALSQIGSAASNTLGTIAGMPGALGASAPLAGAMPMPVNALPGLGSAAPNNVPPPSMAAAPQSNGLPPMNALDPSMGQAPSAPGAMGQAPNVGFAQNLPPNSGGGALAALLMARAKAGYQ